MRGFMRAFTATDDADGLGLAAALGAQHASPGSVHVRPGSADGNRSHAWLQNHRGGLAKCLPSLLVVGSQRSALASVHWLLRRGWPSAVRLNSGEREVHFFSMDNRYKQGVTLAPHPGPSPSPSPPPSPLRYKARVQQVMDGGKKYKISFLDFKYVPIVRAADIRFT